MKLSEIKKRMINGIEVSIELSVGRRNERVTVRNTADGGAIGSLFVDFDDETSEVLYYFEDGEMERAGGYRYYDYESAELEDIAAWIVNTHPIYG